MDRSMLQSSQFFAAIGAVPVEIMAGVYRLPLPFTRNRR